MELTGFPPEIEAMPGSFLQNDPAVCAVAEVYRNGAPYTFDSNDTVGALIITPDGTTTEISQNGTISGNCASLPLGNAATYSALGPIQVALRLINGSRKTTLGVIKGTVLRAQ